MNYIIAAALILISSPRLSGLAFVAIRASKNVDILPDNWSTTHIAGATGVVQSKCEAVRLFNAHGVVGSSPGLVTCRYPFGIDQAFAG